MHFHCIETRSRVESIIWCGQKTDAVSNQRKNCAHRYQQNVPSDYNGLRLYRKFSIRFRFFAIGLTLMSSILPFSLHVGIFFHPDGGFQWVSFQLNACHRSNDCHQPTTNKWILTIGSQAKRWRNLRIIRKMDNLHKMDFGLDWRPKPEIRTGKFN